MKNKYLKAIFIFALFVLAVPVLHAVAQTKVIKNPGTPLNTKTGNRLQLKEVFRIAGNSEDFYLKYPYQLKTAANGSIFLADLKQLLVFTPEGKFKKNLFKKGEGPGEIKGRMAVFVLEDQFIYIFDYYANKMIHIDQEGNLIKEIKLVIDRYNDFLECIDGKFLFWDSELPRERRGSKLYDIRNKLILVSPGFKTGNVIGVFPTKTFLSTSKGGGGMPWASLIFALKGEKKIFVSHTRKYLVKMLDLKSGNIEMTFLRKYKRVKYKEKKTDIQFRKKYNAPTKEYEADIRDMVVFNNLLWVQTSTKDKKKKCDLYDVYDDKGRYIDHFYFESEKRILASTGKYIFVRESDEEDNPVIVKYRVMGW